MSNGRTAIAEFDGVQFIQLHIPEGERPACDVKTEHEMVGSFGVSISVDHSDWCDDCREIEGGSPDD